MIQLTTFYKNEKDKV